jgi:hypothetical protein
VDASDLTSELIRLSKQPGFEGKRIKYERITGYLMLY